MEALSFIAVSTIEYVGVLVAMLALFRYPVRDYWPQILYTSAICSVISYVLSVMQNIALAPLIQLVAITVCIWLMFYTPLIWSLIMNVCFFVAYSLFQGGVFYALYFVGLMPADLPKTSPQTYLIQLLCTAFCISLGFYWIRKRIGFLFVPTSRDTPFVWNTTARWLFVGSIISFFISGIVYMIFPKTQFNWFSLLLAALLVVSAGLLYALKRTNREYVKKPWNY